MIKYCKTYYLEYFFYVRKFKRK